MIAGEQYLHLFEKMAKQQFQIYPDAADRGIRPGETLKNQLRDALKELREIYKSNVTFWGSKDSSWGSETTLFIPFEEEDGLFYGTKLTVSYNFDKVRKVEFISIEFYRCSQSEDPFKE